MSATLNMTMATVGVVVVGKLSKGDGLEFKQAAGAGVAAIGLSLIENIDTKLAELFAGAILLTAALYYLPSITDKLGYTNGGSGNKITIVPNTSGTTPTHVGTTSGTSNTSPVTVKQV